MEPMGLGRVAVPADKEGNGTKEFKHHASTTLGYACTKQEVRGGYTQRLSHLVHLVGNSGTFLQDSYGRSVWSNVCGSLSCSPCTVLLV